MPHGGRRRWETTNRRRRTERKLCWSTVEYSGPYHQICTRWWSCLSGFSGDVGRRECRKNQLMTSIGDCLYKAYIFLQVVIIYLNYLCYRRYRVYFFCCWWHLSHFLTETILNFDTTMWNPSGCDVGWRRAHAIKVMSGYAQLSPDCIDHTMFLDVLCC
jgi:hypothetical protein